MLTPTLGATMHDSWFTPLALMLCMPRVLLDPFWHPDSNVVADNTLCLQHGQDGMAPWPLVSGDGIIWVNPPYSNTSACLAKCEQESQRQAVPLLSLVPAKAGESYWTTTVWPKAAWVAFFPWRLSFDDGTDADANTGTFGNALICYSQDAEQAEAVWDTLASCAAVWPLIRVQVVAGAQQAEQAAIARRGKRKPR
jgi:hypothetical protein